MSIVRKGNEDSSSSEMEDFPNKTSEIQQQNWGSDTGWSRVCADCEQDKADSWAPNCPRLA